MYAKQRLSDFLACDHLHPDRYIFSPPTRTTAVNSPFILTSTARPAHVHHAPPSLPSTHPSLRRAPAHRLAALHDALLLERHLARENRVHDLARSGTCRSLLNFGEIDVEEVVEPLQKLAATDKVRRIHHANAAGCAHLVFARGSLQIWRGANLKIF